jgi:hypothetical protein
MLIEYLDNLANGIDECASWPESWLNFLKNKISDNENLYNERRGNMMYIIKRGPLAYIGDQYINSYPDPNEFKIPITDLIKLIEQFAQLRKLEPNFIVLNEENGKFTLEAKEALD